MGLDELGGRYSFSDFPDTVILKYESVIFSQTLGFAGFEVMLMTYTATKMVSVIRLTNGKTGRILIFTS
jgi:hypothetical protein